MHETLFWHVNLANVDLKGADVRYAVLGDSNVDDADLSEITQVDGSVWTETAWWRAKAISVPLLTHIKKEYLFKSGETYFGRKFSEEDYKKDLLRLEQRPPR